MSYAKIRISLTLQKQLQLHALVVEFQDVFDPGLVAEPMEIEIKAGWSADCLQLMRKFSPVVAVAIETTGIDIVELSKVPGIYDKEGI